MTRVTFCVPVHGREALAAVCLRQLRRTCDAALTFGVEATAIVVGMGPLLALAQTLRFGTVERDNDQLGRKFNDAYQLACDPAFNQQPADYCVPCGSDDWVDAALLSRLPAGDAIGTFRELTVVSEDRTRMARLRVGYKGGCGVRIVPRSLLAPCGYRPCAEDYNRACDTATLEGIKAARRGRFPDTVTLDVHPLQIVDWKTAGTQLNGYGNVALFRRGGETAVDWPALAGVYGGDAVSEMQSLQAAA